MAVVPTLVTLAGLALITVAVLRVPVLEPASGLLAHVDVIIPARNEAGALPGLLADLAADTPGRLIVVDDQSDDATAQVAAQAGATVLSAAGRPDGWNPKVWALHVGVTETDNADRRLVFLDADVRLAHGALGALVAAADAAGGVVSVAPYHCRTIDSGRGVNVAALGAVESLSAPFNVTIDAGGGPGLARNARGAVGSCLTITRTDYDAIGGHAATPNTIVDDLALAATARNAGLPVTLLQAGPARSATRPLVTVRSYPAGFGDMARGWIKNLSAGMGMTPPLSGLAVAVWVTGLLMPIAMVASADPTTAVVLWLIVAVHTWWLTGRVGRFNPIVVSLGAPLLGVWFATVSGLSVIARLTRRNVTWKGRALAPDGTPR